MSGRDKRIIWDDCPQCAHKHLTAAYAALTSDVGDGPVVCMAWEVFHARAEILEAEAIAGYTGNLSLAGGCYAMAESLFSNGFHEVYWRKKRLGLSTSVQAGVDISIQPCLRAFAAGHLYEAVRELPQLSDNEGLIVVLDNGGVNIRSKAQYLEVLRGVIHKLEDDYCLKGEANAKSEKQS